MEAARKRSIQAQQREAKHRNTDYNPEECPVCYEAFDDTEHRPHTLPCGHTVCTSCMKKLKRQCQVTCPECRAINKVPKEGLFSVSFTMEALIRRMRDVKAEAAATASTSAGKGIGNTESPCPEAWLHLPKTMRTFLQEQEARLLAAITTCRKDHSQLDQYQTMLIGWQDHQQQLEEQLLRVIHQSSSARELMQQEESHAVARKMETKKREQQLQVLLETMHTITSEQEIGAVVTDIVHCFSQAEQVEAECQESSPDVSTATTAKKAIEECSAALEAIQAVQAARETQATITTEELRVQSDQDSTIADRLQAILPQSLMEKVPQPLQVNDLRSLTPRGKRLLAAGCVFAIHQIGGHQQHARLSLEEGRVYLHTLREHPLPLGVTTLQVSQLVPPSPPCMVFLDLSWPGNSTHRVHILLPHNTPAGRHFLLLCTGQHGASYANTRLFNVVNRGKPGEFVWGGDYERNDGWGGAALLPGLDPGGYWVSGYAGAVCGWWRGDPARHGALFGITTRGWGGTWQYDHVFGEVVQGLQVLVAAAQHPCISEVTVVDCGVVLWE